MTNYRKEGSEMITGLLILIAAILLIGPDAVARLLYIVVKLAVVGIVIGGVIFGISVLAS